MHIEFRHLSHHSADSRGGGLAPRSREQLNITQSALSHQVKGLKIQAGVELFVRRSKRYAVGLRGCGCSKLGSRSCRS